MNELGFKWVEECYNLADYWSYKDLKKAAYNRAIRVTGSEHEASRYGIRMLAENCDIDILQPDVGWCGSMTELVKTGNITEAHGKLVVPHGSGVYRHHYVTTKVNSLFTEQLMMALQADKVLPQYYHLIRMHLYQ